MYHTTEKQTSVNIRHSKAVVDLQCRHLVYRCESYFYGDYVSWHAARFSNSNISYIHSARVNSSFGGSQHQEPRR